MTEQKPSSLPPSLKANEGRRHARTAQIPQSPATFGTRGQKADDSASLSQFPHPVNGRQLSAVIGEFKTATPR